MAFPILTAIGLGALGYRASTEISDRRAAAKERARQEMAVDNLLSHLVLDPDADLSGVEAAFRLSPEMALALDEAFAIDMDDGMDMLQSILTAQVNSYENKLDRELDWENADIKRDTLAHNQNVLEQDIREFEASVDADLQRMLKRADRGEYWLVDPITGIEVQTLTPGSTEWQDEVEGATLVGQAAELYSAYAASVGAFGILRDPQHEAYGEQEALRTQLSLAIKEATNAGALDQGLLDTVERLTGSPLDAADYLVGQNDATALRRINAMGQMFENQYGRASGRVRNLIGVDDTTKSRFQRAGARLRYVRQQVIPEAIQRARLSPDMRLTPQRSSMREFGNVAVNNLDVLGTAALLGGAGFGAATNLLPQARALRTPANPPLR